MGAYIYRLFDNLQHVGARGMNVGWSNPQRFDPDTIHPNATLAPEINPAVANAWNAWVEIEPAVPSDCVLGMAQISLVTQATTRIYIQIGTGAAGAEVPICELETGSIISGAGAIPAFGESFRLPAIKITSGTRLVMRAWVTNTSCDIDIYIQTYPSSPNALWQAWTDQYVGGNDATSAVRNPAVPNYVTAPATPAWAQIVAAAPSKSLVRCVSVHDANPQGVIELGIGAAGAERVTQRYARPISGGVIRPPMLIYASRPVLVLANERLSVRMNPSGATGGVAIYLENLTI